MTRNKSITFLAGATALVVAALAAGCGSSGGSNANVPAPPQNASGQSATRRRREGKRRQDPRRLAGPHALPVRARLGHEELMHRRLRRRVAAPAGDRQADGRRWSECFDRRDQRPLGRQAAGHLQRPPALPVLGRPEGRRHERTGRECLRRPLVRGVVVGRRNHHARRLWWRSWLLGARGGRQLVVARRSGGSCSRRSA